MSYGDAYSTQTWSGTASKLVAGLEEEGMLAGAVNARPKVLEYLEKAASLSPDRARWRERYHATSSPLSPAIRRLMGWVGDRAARPLAGDADAVLQFSAWFTLDRAPSLSGGPYCAYLDSSLSMRLRRPGQMLDRSERQIRRTLAFERQAYDKLDLVMTFSEWARQYFIEDFDQPPEKFVVVGAGANLESLPGPFERDFDPPRLLFVGRSFVRKGGPQLVEAFRRVRAEHPDAVLWVVGPSDRIPDEPGVTQFGLLRRAVPEEARELDRLYKEATALVLPSLYEGSFAIPYLEAMAYRLPVVATNVSAIPEIVEDGINGYIIEPGDVDELTDRILALLALPDRGRAMGEAGHERFMERFTWNAVARRMAEAIKGVGR